MQELPLVSEIREARQRLEAVQGAGQHLHFIEAARMSLGVVERQRGEAPTILPGDEAILMVGDRWTHLADIATPSRHTHSASRLLERRAQLDTLADALRPLAKDESRYAHQLHDLQHDQHHLLKDPKYADELAEVARIGALRDDVYSELSPRQARQTGVAPARTVIRAFGEQLAWVHAATADKNGVTAWRAATIAISLLDVLRSCLVDTGFELAIPEDIDVPESPNPADSDRLFLWVREQLGEVEALHGGLTLQTDALNLEIEALEAQLRQLNQTLQDWLG